MQVIRDLNSFTAPEIAIVTQGTFDGVHAGHRQILGNIVKIAKQKGGKSILVTFHPHPRHVLYKTENTLKLLTTFDEKIELLSDIGIDYLIVLPFDENFSKMEAHQFIREIMVNHLGVNTMVVGYDHRFGRNREGSFEDLQEYAHMFGFEVIEIAAHDIEHATVSSTKIRHSLLEGDVETAALFLGRAYALNGTVIHGRKMGKDLGYPTANLHVANDDKLIPANGIYAVKVEHDKQVYGGMMSIGNNPTIQGAKWSIEVHIFDFNRDIYGEDIKITFVKKMRNEEKYADIGLLMKQLKADEIEARTILNTTDHSV